MPFLPRAATRAVSLVIAVVLVSSASGCTPKPTLAQLDHTVYDTSLSSFRDWWRREQARAQRVPVATIDRWLATAPTRLDSAAARSRPWDLSTDLCSSAPDSGSVFDFRVPCIRHDFAWRNLRRLDRQAGGGIDTRIRRLATSRQFLRDMQTTCALRPLVQRAACGVVARTYFQAVTAVS